MAALGAEGEIVRGPGASAGLVTFRVRVFITAVKGERRGGVRGRRVRVRENCRFITGEFKWVAISPSFGKAENNQVQIHHADDPAYNKFCVQKVEHKAEKMFQWS